MIATLVLVFAAALVVLAAVWLITGRMSLAQSQPDADERPGLHIREADGRITAESLTQVRFETAARGYRMDQVDAVIAAIIEQLQPPTAGEALGEPSAISATLMPAVGIEPQLQSTQPTRGRRVVDLELSTRVAAPAMNVWRAVVDWPSQGEWMLLTKVRVSRGDGMSIGSELSAFTGIGRLGFLDTMTITAWNPPYSCDVLHTGRVVRGTGSMRVVADGPDAAVFYWQESLELPWGWLGRLGWIAGGWVFIAGVKRSLAKFAQAVEAKSNGAA